MKKEYRVSFYKTVRGFTEVEAENEEEAETMVERGDFEVFDVEEVIIEAEVECEVT